jgi:acyl transferase domain-containing protein/acyl carrier protein
MLAAGDSAEEIKDALEALTLGRLRLASKGLVREDDGVLTAVDAPRRHRDGMYMIGQVATLRNQVISAEQLHQEMVDGAAHWLNRGRPAHQHRAEYGPDRPSDIAVIGIGTLLPDAQEPQDYWLNILNKVDSIQVIPANRWDWRLYFDADPQARDRIYSKWGGFLDDVPFDPLRFGIPPKSLKSIEPLQLLALEVVRRALEDAGYATAEFDRENTSVILGAGGGLADLGQQYATRSEIPRYVENPDEGVWDRLPEWTEESFPGVLLNVIAGRVANRFDLRGTNHTVDAACASSLAAIDLAVKDLESGHSNMAIVGGVDTIQSPFAFYCFSKSQALSPRGRCRSFDQSADGIAISEGLAVVVLKRLGDAERDGDRIYGVIKAVGGSSDGKALGMTAPRPEGQMLALGRAYGKAGFAPSTLGLYEAHGTGTAVGDRAELETLVTTMNEHQAHPKACVLGSVKTMIGHTKSTAGVAGLVKAVLALHHRVQPPHANVEQPLAPITDPSSPVYLLREARPWIAHPDYPRRAGVSAFGFGGTNFHAVLEEYAAASVKPQGADRWPCELLILRAASKSALVEEIERLRRALVTGARPRLVDLAFSYIHRAQARQADTACLALVVESLEQLAAALELILNHLRQEQSLPLPPYIFLGLEAAIKKQSIAFLFPGQGSQYPNMAREVALYCPEMRQSIEFADRCLDADQLGGRLSSFIYPPASYSDQEEEEFRLRLTNTQIAQPALGAIAAGYIDLAARLGLTPAMTCGHSYGEYVALYCAGVLSREDLLNLSATRGRVMAMACADSNGTMAAVQAAREDLMPHLDGFGQVVIANHNSPSQSVISGPSQAINEVMDNLNKAGILARLLPVAGAFHSPLVASAQDGMEAHLATAELRLPAIPVYANATASPYAAEPDAIRQQLSHHLTSPVNYLGQIEAIYEAGARVFIELGPKSVLTKLVAQILEKRPYTAVSLDGQGGNLSGFLAALGQLSTQGVGLQLLTLFDGRDVARLDPDRLDQYQNPSLPRSAWLVNGGNARPQGMAVGHTGKLPPLTFQTKVSAAAPPVPQPATPPLVVSPLESEAGTKLLTNIYGTPNLSVTPSQSSPQPHPMTYSDQPAVPSIPDPILVAYQAHQATMFQFLAVQERVVSHFLECQSGRMGSQTSAVPPGVPHQVQSLAMAPPPPSSMAAVPVPAPATVPPAPLPGSPQRFSSSPEVTVQNDVALNPASPKGISQNGSIQNGKSPSNAVEAGADHPPASASAPAPAPARDELLRQLLDLVSDRTGYPTDMLGLDQDLEAELGIDSIKRVEILGAMQKNLGADLATLVQQDMEALTRVKTLNGLIDRLLRALPAPLPLPEPEVVSTPAANTELVPAAGMDRAQLLSTLLELVSDRTGYPTDMLGLDQDLEAELGIDSIKRVEILGALQKTLPPALGELFQQQMEQMTRTKSLNALVDQLMALASITTPESRLGKPPLPQSVSPAT